MYVLKYSVESQNCSIPAGSNGTCSDALPTSLKNTKEHDNQLNRVRSSIRLVQALFHHRTSQRFQRRWCRTYPPIVSRYSSSHLVDVAILFLNVARLFFLSPLHVTILFFSLAGFRLIIKERFAIAFANTVVSR